MEEAKREYKQLTGSEPKNLVVLGDETGRRLAEQFADISGDLNYDPSVREMEFIKVKRTEGGYFIRLIDVHKKEDGHYAGVTLDVDHVLVSEIGPAISSLEVGSSAVYCLKGNNASEIIRQRRAYVHGEQQPSVQGHIDRILSRDITETELMRNHSFEIRGDDSKGYVADVKVGVNIHARPSKMIVEAASKYDYCDVYIKYGTNAVSAKSILGILTLEASVGSDLLLEANGDNARKCLEELVKLFKTNFGEA